MTDNKLNGAASFAPPPEKHPLLAKPLSFLANPRRLHNPRRLKAEVKGKIVLITGASYGLGEAAAKMFAAAGAKVLITARTQEKLEAVAAEIRAAGGRVHVYATDLGDPDKARALAGQVLAEHDHVDVLIHNAGKSLRRSIALSYDRYRDFERTMAINYHGPVALTLGLLPAMRARKSGHIVNVSTIGVRVPPGPRWAAYQASKGAFDTWMRSVALEMGADEVGLTTIYMALMYTRMSSPTPVFHYAPGLMPDDAAGLLARAVVEKPREISPPWLRPLELGSVVFRRPVDWAMSLSSRVLKDTTASQSASQPDSGKQE